MVEEPPGPAEACAPKNRLLGLDGTVLTLSGRCPNFQYIMDIAPISMTFILIDQASQVNSGCVKAGMNIPRVLRQCLYQRSGQVRSLRHDRHNSAQSQALLAHQEVAKVVLFGEVSGSVVREEEESPEVPVGELRAGVRTAQEPT